MSTFFEIITAIILAPFYIIGLFIPPSAEEIAKATVVQQERVEFEKTHTRIVCPQMSKRAKGEKLNNGWLMASTTYGHSFWEENSIIGTSTYDKQKRCEEDYLEDWEEII